MGNMVQVVGKLDTQGTVVEQDTEHRSASANDRLHALVLS